MYFEFRQPGMALAFCFGGFGVVDVCDEVVEGLGRSCALYSSWFVEAPVDIDVGSVRSVVFGKLAKKLPGVFLGCVGRRLNYADIGRGEWILFVVVPDLETAQHQFCWWLWRVCCGLR